MIRAAQHHFIGRLAAADVVPSPYPHIYLTRCFPEWYYEEMLKELPPDSAYTDRTFENRAMCRIVELPGFWKELSEWMLTRETIIAVLEVFGLKKNVQADVRLVRDSEGYKIKPHTDIKSKLLSLLFYLPKEDTDGGTSIMVPKEPGFTSDGLKRFEFQDFNKVYTAPFSRNTMFGFPRSDISFHGVEPTTMKQRDVLLLNIYAPT